MTDHIPTLTDRVYLKNVESLFNFKQCGKTIQRLFDMIEELEKRDSMNSDQVKRENNTCKAENHVIVINQPIKNWFFSDETTGYKAYKTEYGFWNPCRRKNVDRRKVNMGRFGACMRRVERRGRKEDTTWML